MSPRSGDEQVALQVSDDKGTPPSNTRVEWSYHDTMPACGPKQGKLKMSAQCDNKMCRNR